MKKSTSSSMLEMAWVILAKAHGGSWDLASDDWRGAVEKWRDKYFTMLKEEKQMKYVLVHPANAGAPRIWDIVQDESGDIVCRVYSNVVDALTVLDSFNNEEE